MQLNTAALDTAIEEWFQLTMTTAQELGKRFSHRPRWILDKMFYRGAHVKKKNKTNAWNAWASQLCAKVNAGQYHAPSYPVSMTYAEHRTRRGAMLFHLWTSTNSMRVSMRHSHPLRRKQLLWSMSRKKFVLLPPLTSLPVHGFKTSPTHTNKFLTW